MHMTNPDVDLANRLADVADAAVLRHFRQQPDVENKASVGFDPVTVADREAESVMRALLAAERPHDAVWGEEFEATPGRSGRTWVLDPIDGTRAFMCGLPTWGVLIALADAEGPVLGLMSQPFVGERFLAAGKAVHLAGGRETPLATRRCETLGDAIVAATHPEVYAGADARRFARLTAATRMTRFGTDCYGYAMLAAGLVDVVYETQLKPVDIAPFVPLIEQAGGALVDRTGAPLRPSLPHAFAGTAIAVGDPALLPAVLDLLV